MPQHGPVDDQRLHNIIIIGIHTCRLSPCSIEITFSDSISIKEYVPFVALNPRESIRQSPDNTTALFFFFISSTIESLVYILLMYRRRCIQSLVSLKSGSGSGCVYKVDECTKAKELLTHSCKKEGTIHNVIYGKKTSVCG